MNIKVSASSFGIAGINDAAEAAIQLLERTDKIGELLVDLGKVPQVIFRADSSSTAKALQELGCVASVSSNGDSDSVANNPTELMTAAREYSWVELAPGMDKYKHEDGFSPKLLVADCPPSNPSFFCQVIQIDFTADGKTLVVKTDGQAIAAVNTAGAQGRFDSDFKRALNSAAENPRASSRKLTAKIILPETSPLASLEQEIKHLNAVIVTKMTCYKPPKGKFSEAILAILLIHAEERVEVKKAEQARLCRIIEYHMAKQKPIPIGLSFAIGTRILNPLKFRELVMLPTWAWLHFGLYFKIINEKIRCLYPPGIKVTIFDEATLFAPVMGIPADGVAQLLTVARMMFSQLKAPIEIMELRPEWFPERELVNLSVQAPPEQIYAMLCSLPDMADPEIMRFLYVDRNRDYAEIKKRAGDQWQRAEKLVLELNKRLAYRKRVNLFTKLLQEELYIDGCVTDKTDRLVFDITSPALINHGMPVVLRTEDGQLKVVVVPEYRIESEHRNARPIKISPAEFGLPNLAPYTFYYLVE